jgi:hypothetical protein
MTGVLVKSRDVELERGAPFAVKTSAAQAAWICATSSLMSG